MNCIQLAQNDSVIYFCRHGNKTFSLSISNKCLESTSSVVIEIMSSVSDVVHFTT
jgi:hypothetical protein